MSLSANVIFKAKTLVKNGLVKQDKDSEFVFYVKSSSGGHYKVEYLKDNKKFDLYCECQGWKYNQDCSHCEAVRIFKKENKKKKRGKKK